MGLAGRRCQLRCGVSVWGDPGLRSGPRLPGAPQYRGGLSGVSPIASERDLHAGVEGAGPRRTKRTRIRERRTTIAEIGDLAGIEERSIGRVAIVGDVVGLRVKLKRLGDLIGRIQVKVGVRWQLH